jgi:hypothetical protein
MALFSATSSKLRVARLVTFLFGGVTFLAANMRKVVEDHDPISSSMVENNILHVHEATLKQMIMIYTVIICNL